MQQPLQSQGATWTCGTHFVERAARAAARCTTAAVAIKRSPFAAAQPVKEP